MIKYKSKSEFKTVKEYNNYINEHTYKIVYLQDIGQDVTKLWVSEFGEVLKTNSIDETVTRWRGVFVKICIIGKTETISIFDNIKEDYIFDNFIEKYEIVNK